MADPADAEVATPTVAYSTMAQKWDLIDAEWGGSVTMRAKGETYLPKQKLENNDDYSNRLQRSFLFPGFKDGVKNLAAKPFCKPVSVEGKLDERLDGIKTNCDRNGTDITKFAKAMLERGIAWGIHFILVDYPAKSADSLKQEREEDIRPYFVHIAGTEMIGVHSERRGSGRAITKIRWKERRCETVGAYGEEEVEYVHVYTDKVHELWKKDTDGKWVEAQPPIEHTFPDGVPVVWYITGEETGFCQADPPLYELAEVNLCHWQNYSDHLNILRFAKLGILFGTGFSEDQVDKGVDLGPSAQLLVMNTEATLQYVEHSGKAIEIGRTELIDMKEDMEMLAKQPLLQQAGNPTATGKSIDEAKAHSSMQSWVRGLENALEQAYRIAAKWIGVELPEDFKVDVFSDFGVSLKATEDVASLIAMYAAGAISLMTFLREVKRRGLISDTVQVEDEVDAIEQEAPKLMLLPPAPKPGDPVQPGQKEQPPFKKAA